MNDITVITEKLINQLKDNNLIGNIMDFNLPDINHIKIRIHYSSNSNHEKDKEEIFNIQKEIFEDTKFDYNNHFYPDYFEMIIYKEGSADEK